MWSRDISQRISYFDRCQLAITWMSKFKEGYYKPGFHVSVNYGHFVGQLRRWTCPQVIPSHDKINLWFPFRCSMNIGLRDYHSININKISKYELSK